MHCRRSASDLHQWLLDGQQESREASRGRLDVALILRGGGDDGGAWSDSRCWHSDANSTRQRRRQSSASFLNSAPRLSCRLPIGFGKCHSRAGSPSLLTGACGTSEAVCGLAVARGEERFIKATQSASYPSDALFPLLPAWPCRADSETVLMKLYAAAAAAAATAAAIIC